MPARLTILLSTTLWLSLLSSCVAYADVVTDWNITARNIVVEAKLHTPPANRLMGLVHTAIFAAANSVSGEYPQSLGLAPSPGASVDSAVASACFWSLTALLPKQRTTIEAAYSKALKTVPDGPNKDAGILAGKKAAEAVLATRASDGADLQETYRPLTTAGGYVPTVIPAVPAWPKRQPWLLASAAQFRPTAPPALDSRAWARDFNEVKEMGAVNSTKRTKEQTAMALFWEATLPPIYHGLVHSVALQAGRSPTQNARLFAVITQATDDALIAVFEAKYHYAFWRPITAIRNADQDNNKTTQRDASWTPYISTPMHPEYPCAHCVVAATVGTILEAEVGDNPMPVLTTTSTTAHGATRSWSTIKHFIQEVSDARIYDGVHYRSSTEAGNKMGRRIGALAVSSFE